MSLLSSLGRAALIGAVLAPSAHADEPDTAASLMFLCPINVLQAAYAGLTDPTDALSVLAIERHVLAICRESQEQLLVIHQNNERLRELFGVGFNRPDDDSDEAPVAVVATAPAEPVLELVAVIRRGGERSALVRVDGVSERVFADGALTSGHRVAAIGADHVTVVSADGVETRIE